MAGQYIPPRMGAGPSFPPQVRTNIPRLPPPGYYPHPVASPDVVYSNPANFVSTVLPTFQQRTSGHNVTDLNQQYYGENQDSSYNTKNQQFVYSGQYSAPIGEQASLHHDEYQDTYLGSYNPPQNQSQQYLPQRHNSFKNANNDQFYYEQQESHDQSGFPNAQTYHDQARYPISQIYQYQGNTRYPEQQSYQNPVRIHNQQDYQDPVRFSKQQGNRDPTRFNSQQGNLFQVEQIRKALEIGNDQQEHMNFAENVDSQEESNEEDDESESESEEDIGQTSKPTKVNSKKRDSKIGAKATSDTSRRGRRQASYVNDKEEELEEDLNSKRKPTRKSSIRVKVKNSSEESDDDGVKMLPKVEPSKSFRSQPAHSFKSAKEVKVAKSPKDLSPLGAFDTLASTDANYKLIEKYVQNSHGIGQFSGEVIITAIYRLQQPPPHALLASQTGHHGKVLLWVKTSPGSIRGLAENKNACVAFYDRLARAFSIKPEEIEDTFQQIILLCEVSLGKLHKSRMGYSHWSNQALPSNCNSIFAAGRHCPDWDDAKDINSLIIPYGKTRKAKGTAELDFNEYIVYQASRIKVMYAINIEIDKRTNRRIQSNFDEGKETFRQ